MLRVGCSVVDQPGRPANEREPRMRVHIWRYPDIASDRLWPEVGICRVMAIRPTAFGVDEVPIER